MRRQLSPAGMTLVELVVAMGVSIILIAGVGVLLDGGNRAWLRAYKAANDRLNIDAQALTAAFGAAGRRSNRGNYVLYTFAEGILTPALPPSGQPDSVVFGDAVEFRYWDVPLNTTDSYNLMDSDTTATAYALFYLDGDTMKVDYGSYPPGAAPVGGGNRNTSGISTAVLAKNVSADSGHPPFSHTTVGATGQGSVRLDVTLTDPNDDSRTMRVMTSTLLRNIWPR
jgi:type II secretory pathway pseudopilin PulG